MTPDLGVIRNRNASRKICIESPALCTESHKAVQFTTAAEDIDILLTYIDELKRRVTDSIIGGGEYKP